MLGYQASGAAPIVRGKIGRESGNRRDRDPHRQSGFWELAVAAKQRIGRLVRRMHATRKSCTSQKLLAETEGIFCEPASAISLAGVLKDLELGVIGEGSTIVCTLTGHGLKDPDTAIAQSSKPFVVDADARRLSSR